VRQALSTTVGDGDHVERWRVAPISYRFTSFHARVERQTPEFDIPTFSTVLMSACRKTHVMGLTRRAPRRPVNPSF
jgi:hypothetical protein